MTYTENTLWNPTTQTEDKVRLRSFKGTGIDPETPYVAPTIRVYPGETVRLGLANRLPEDDSCFSGHSDGDDDDESDVNVPHCFNGTNMHTHGLWINPAGNSDNVLISINPGVDFQYEYNIPEDHPAGTFWYHPHRHGSTALQVSSGMAGALIVNGIRPPTETTNGDIDTLLQSTKEHKFTERIMVFQQIQYACYADDVDPRTGDIEKNDDDTYKCEDGQTGVIENYNEFNQWPESGRFTSINGKIQPVLNKIDTSHIERWRMIQAGVHESIDIQIRKLKAGTDIPERLSAKEHESFINNNCTGDIVQQHLIANDGLTTSHIRAMDSIVFQPGYRRDVLIVFPEKGKYCVIDDEAAASDTIKNVASPPRLMAVVNVETGADIDSDIKQHLDQVLISAAKQHYPSKTAKIIVEDLKNHRSLSKYVQHKNIEDEEITNDEPRKADFRSVGGGVFTINDEVYDPDRIDHELVLGTTEEWLLTSSAGNHPFHIHVNPFQVLKILDPAGNDVSVPGVDDAGDTQYPGLKGNWMDTIMIKAGYEVYIRTRYERYIGDFVLHCHILDHEDQGMMQNVRISLPDGEGGISHGHH